MFWVGLTHARGRHFHVEGAVLTCSVIFGVPFWNIWTFISRVCLINQVRKLNIDREKLDLWEKRKLRMCVFVCIGGWWGECTNYILKSTHEKGLEPPPQLNIVSNCVKGRSCLETRLNQPWVLTFGQNEYNNFFRLHVNQSITKCRGQFRMRFIF